MLFITPFSLAWLNLWFVNSAMHLYNLLDVVPILMASNMLFDISQGLVTLDEQSFYTTKDFIFIGLSVFFCIFGIIILMLKNKETIKTKAMAKDEEEF